MSQKLLEAGVQLEACMLSEEQIALLASAAQDTFYCGDAQGRGQGLRPGCRRRPLLAGLAKVYTSKMPITMCDLLPPPGGRAEGPRRGLAECTSPRCFSLPTGDGAVAFPHFSPSGSTSNCTTV